MEQSNLAGPEVPGPDAGLLAEPPCPTCAGGHASLPLSYIYALGRISPRFPCLSVEKEFAQAARSLETGGLTDPEVLHKVLSQPGNQYLARQLCWVMTIEGLDAYVLQPRDPADLELLVAAVRPRPTPGDLDVVIGARGPIASAEHCNGLMLPSVLVIQVYSFDRDALVQAIPRPETIPEPGFAAAAHDIVTRIMQMADNAGATDEHRALNYLAVRYPAIYATAAECHGRNCSLAAVDVRPSRLTGARKVVDVVFSYVHRQTDVAEKYFVRVDVSDEFPFLVSKLAPYYDR